jgi:hypothetical protein
MSRNCQLRTNSNPERGDAKHRMLPAPNLPECIEISPQYDLDSVLVLGLSVEVSLLMNMHHAMRSEVQSSALMRDG